MNEVEFVLRRILTEAEEYAIRRYEEGIKTPEHKLFAYNKRQAQLELINHLRKQFGNEGK